MRKKALYSSGLMLIIITFIVIFSLQAPTNEVVFTLDDETSTASFKHTNLLQWQLIDGITYEAYGYTFSAGTREVVDKIQATDFIHTVDVVKTQQVIGQLEVTIRQIDNGDVFIFTKFNKTSDIAYTIPLKLTFAHQSHADLFAFQQEIPQEHDKVFGIDYTTNVKGIYSFEHSPMEMVLSQNYISRELVEQYNKEEQSVVRELINEDLYVEEVVTDDDLVFHLKLRTTAGEQISENWFLIANDVLFNSNAEQAFYKDYTNHYFIRSQKWLVHGGNYSKLPWSIEPGTTLGYGRNLVRLKDNTLTERYQQTKDRFYYNLMIDNANNLIDFKGDDELWLTEYTSAWLKRDYGIQAPYTDTRHNENIALFLSDAGDILNNEQLQASYLYYADFLTNQQRVGNILNTDNGYYILDYYSPTQTKKTHVSLNHALGEMNFLFDAYTLSGDEAYFDTALSIKAAIEDIGVQWINPSNGDLWYQINGDYSFQDTDYETLTMEDLLKSLRYYKQLNLPIPALYDTLLESKINFIKASNIALNKAVYTALLETKYADLIKGYTNLFLSEN